MQSEVKFRVVSSGVVLRSYTMTLDALQKH